ncbi:MAG: prolyl oligopeptidase family serine peptidase, partial [Actinobacteria bacterium]|nr:prolyl oligopeptidase family serine peptidase [Actinomycetota bacterium]NIS35605.1 prolyl oligopeptidase family serine peptidase [Actinomycetota bacterium]NIT98214.1 prolyl oligopeptidase family serine peptidase [Actinomycetota bacterium]NIU21844.1 prolyl oligopeptidase family serine peptidase [Actinomycetota bacterium]NIU70260.1 prolyl oligopeptidase family serine peptidase [Actinomycetota bacterium]
GSAGGLLIGAVANLAPEHFAGLVADVPFVDVVTTMLDESIPLTTFEYDEWGNPNERDDYEYMLSYSPYDNVAAQDYPHMLVTTGLHDSQV